MPKVLVADDSIAIQKVVEYILSERGYDLRVVGSPSDAIEAVSEFGPDVFLVDINMPGMSGYEVAARVRGNPLTKDLPIILLAGAFESVDMGEVEAAGINDTLIKPFEADDLAEKIETQLRGGAASAAPVEAVEEGAVEEEAGMFDLGGEAEAAALEVEEEAIEAEAIEVEVFEEAAPARAAAGGAVAIDAATLEAAFAAAIAKGSKGAGLAGMIEKSVDARVSAMMSGVDVGEIMIEVVGAGLKESIERTLMDVIPELAESVIRERMEEAMNAVRSEIENIIWETVPDLAEAIITKEIERIKAER